MNIALTGSSGFIGTHILELLKEEGHKVICLSRNVGKSEDVYSFDEYFDDVIDCDIDYFIHLASPNYDYCKDGSLRAGIVDLTNNIIQKLSDYKCKYFIYFSTAKVYGEPSYSNISFTELSPLNPVTDYAKAKYEAEKNIMFQSHKNEFKYIIYRLPMVYGPGMKSNIGNLLKLINKSLPFFYFQDTNNFKKSLVSIENIKQIIKFNINNTSSMKNIVLNIADKDSFSLNEIIFEYKRISSSNSIILPLPKFMFNLFSRFPIFKKLYGNFVIDNQQLENNRGLNILNITDGLTTLNVSMKE